MSKAAGAVTLSEQQAEAVRLDAAIAANLAALGFPSEKLP